MKQTTFPRIDDAKWREVAETSLRGLPFEKLITKTLEDIDIEPLYTKEAFERQYADKHDAMLKTIRKGIGSQNWTIAQRSYAKDGAKFLEDSIVAIEKGNEAIVYDGAHGVVWTDDQLKKLATLMTKYPIYAFQVHSNDDFLSVFNNINESDRALVRGAVTGYDIDLPNGYDNVRTVVADLVEDHDRGADIVTELALTLAIATEQLEEYDSFTAFANDFIVRYAIDTNFFMEMAKLRAFRLLWQTLAEAYGEKEAPNAMIYTETSLRTYSKLDIYVNLLRAGNEAFSAVLGGADVVTVHPHDVLSAITPQSERIARNVQLVIKEETFVHYVLDPAGGSYYIDSLTDQLVEKAWQAFLEIEEKGGYLAYVNSDAYNEKIASLHEKRLTLLSTHKASLIGTNIYADLENVIEDDQPTLVVENRLAEPYENFRNYFKENQLNVVLLNFGMLKDYKPRADFAKGFLAAGGIEVSAEPAFNTTEEGAKWAKENSFDYAIICASAKETETFVDGFVEHFPGNKKIDVAGKCAPELAEKWQAKGIHGFIYKGQDQLEKFQLLQSFVEKEGR